MDKQEKQLRKEYHKMLKQHKKQIMKAAELAATDPWDGECGLEVFIEHLKFMKDYYALGYNVWAAEIEGHKPRLEGITEAIEEYNLGYDVDEVVLNKYFNYAIDPDFKLTEVKEDTFGKAYQLEAAPGYGEPLNGLTRDEANEAYQAELKEHKKKFYDIIINELGTWWD